MTVKFSEEQRVNAVKLYQDGYSVIEVEGLTGISSEYVKNLLKKYNVNPRPAGFQIGNVSRTNNPHSEFTKNKISNIHKCSGHKPSKEAVEKGQPLSLVSRWKDHQKDPIKHLMGSYNRGAIKRGLIFDLSREDFESIIFQNCCYCGSAPSLRHLNGCDIICNGIDRVDNSLGYFTKNCVPACKICNVMKSTNTSDVFIRQCILISKRFENEK